MNFVSSLRFEGKKIHCFSRDQSLSVLLYSNTKQKHILKNVLRFLRHQATFNCTLRSRTTEVNISRVTVNCFPFDVIELNCWGSLFSLKAKQHNFGDKEHNFQKVA